MRTLLSMILATAAVAVASPASAQIVLTGGEVHIGDGTVIEGGSVVIDADGRIGAVGKSVAAPQNARTIDVSGKTVTPGFIDVSTALGLTEIWAVTRTRDSDPGGLDGERDRVRAAFRAVDALNPTSVAIPVTRVHGVTTVVSSPGGGLVSGQAALIDLAGDVGHLTVAEPYVALSVNLGSQGGDDATSRGGAILQLREVLDDAKFWKANEGRFNENRSRSLAASRLDLAALSQAIDDEIPVFLHVNKASDIRAALAVAREFGLRPVIVGGAEAWMIAAELARDNVPVVIEPTRNVPWSFETLGARLDNGALLAAAGVPVVLSTFHTHNVRTLRYMAGNAVRSGMKHSDALESVTSNAAAAVGADDQYGTLEAGKIGNVVVWSGDPFEPSTRVERVIVRGTQVPLESRQSMLFERYRTLERRGEPADQAPSEPEEEGSKRDQTGGNDVESDD